ncbi:hypothetical protein RCCGEPOP_32703 [Rhizobium sp. Pop5]|nr:hypothetical protein RCCGEPOP_32703 [Rhizobium sp. Pop5]
MKSRRPFRSSVVLVWGTMLLAIGQTACTIAGDDIAVVLEAPRVSRAYAYPASATERQAPTPVRAVAYHGSAPYICSPSGFGQKSRCFARPSI